MLIVTLSLSPQVYYGLGFDAGNDPHVNDTFENAGYGSGGISWLTHKSFNQTNLFSNPKHTSPFAGRSEV